MRLPKREGVAVPCLPEVPTPLTFPMTNGESSNPSSPMPSPVDAHVLTKQNTRTLERHLLRAEGRMCLAPLTPRLLLALADRLPLLQSVAHGWHLGADTCRPARKVASLGWPRAYSQRRHHRLPNGQDYRERWSSRLRRWQENER